MPIKKLLIYTYIKMQEQRKDVKAIPYHCSLVFSLLKSSQSQFSRERNLQIPTLSLSISFLARLNEQKVGKKQDDDKKWRKTVFNNSFLSSLRSRSRKSRRLFIFILPPFVASSTWTPRSQVPTQYPILQALLPAPMMLLFQWLVNLLLLISTKLLLQLQLQLLLLFVLLKLQLLLL